MKLMAVICEYNPFHNGHAYQLEKQKEALHCDGVICLMSGSFVQRGEPAVFDKWARCEMALASGADLVLELPVVYSLQSAEGFARGAVSLLARLGAEGYLSFGSESGDVALLERVAGLSDTPAYQASVKEHLATGISYPKACSLAMESICPTPLLPNDTLGVEYIRSIFKTNAKLIPSVIRRDKGQHDGLVAEDDFLSATGIRKLLASGEDVSKYMPQTAYEILQREMQAGRGPVTTENLGSILCYVLRLFDKKNLANQSGISEGLESRLIEAASESRSFDEIAMAAKTKRYPYTRICRTLIKILLGITKEDEKLTPGYARILGVGKEGGRILRTLQKSSSIPFINKVSAAKLTEPESKRLFDLDVAATDLYALLYPQKNTGKSGMDFCRSPVVLFND